MNSCAPRPGSCSELARYCASLLLLVRVLAAVYSTTVVRVTTSRGGLVPMHVRQQVQGQVVAGAAEAAMVWVDGGALNQDVAGISQGSSETGPICCDGHRVA